MDPMQTQPTPAITQPAPEKSFLSRLGLPVIILFGCLLLLAIGAHVGYFIAKSPLLPITGQTACTLEAKICPDGSSVGRSGPHCEFAACPGALTTSSQNPVSAPIISAGNVSTIKPNNLRLSKILYIDFSGNGTKDVVLIGTDTQHLAGAQAGPEIEQPLIDVFRYDPSAAKWNQIASLNYQHFPTGTNGSTLMDTRIVEVGMKEALVVTSYVSGSRVNSLFQTLSDIGGTVTATAFPRADYSSVGGNSPHKIDSTVNGKITVTEGLYKPTDSNNSPTDGTLTTVYQLTDSGIQRVSSQKTQFNIQGM